MSGGDAARRSGADPHRRPGRRAATIRRSRWRRRPGGRSPAGSRPDGSVQMGCAVLLGFDDGGVLDVVAGAASQVGPEPAAQLGEVQRIKRGPAVVVVRRLLRASVDQHRTVGGPGEAAEQRRPVLLPVRSGEHPPDGAGVHREPRQVGHILPPPGRPHVARGSSDVRMPWHSPPSWRPRFLLRQSLRMPSARPRRTAHCRQQPHPAGS